MLTTLALVKAELRQNQQVVSKPEEERFALSCVTTASFLVEQRTQRWFMPRYKTRYLDANPVSYHFGLVEGNTLHLDHMLVTLEEVRKGGVILSSDSYSAHPQGDSHANRIVHAGGWASTCPDSAIAITGTWCFHPSPSRAWGDSTDQLLADVDAVSPFISVKQVEGEDAHFCRPRFSAGQILRLDDEYCWVGRTDATQNQLHVQRGMNGSVATSHKKGTHIDIFAPFFDIQQAATRWAGYLYQHRSQYATTEIEGLNAKRFPADAPSDVEAVLRRYSVHR
jgi:hypothetical protein